MSNELELAGPLEAVFKNPEQVRDNIKIFRKAIGEILDPKVDILMVQGKPHIKKSGCNALNAYFGVDAATVSSWVTQLPDDEYSVSVSVKCSTKGHSVTRSGTCTSVEMRNKHKGKDFDALHSACYGMAETRAVGRATLAFFMVADVAAEEVEGSPGFHPQTEQTQHAKEVPQGHCSHPDEFVELIDPTEPGNPHICGKCKKPIDAGTVARIRRSTAESSGSK